MSAACSAPGERSHVGEEAGEMAVAVEDRADQAHAERRGLETFDALSACDEFEVEAGIDMAERGARNEMNPVEHAQQLA
jgi:hypothetical protein